MSLRLTSVRVQEPDLPEVVHFRFRPIPVPLKDEQLYRLRLCLAQQPLGQIPASAPFGIKRHRPALRSATHRDQLASISLSSRSAWCCLWEWSGNRRQNNGVFREKAARSVEVLRLLLEAIPASGSAPELGRALAGRITY